MSFSVQHDAQNDHLNQHAHQKLYQKSIQQLPLCGMVEFPTPEIKKNYYYFQPKNYDNRVIRWSVLILFYFIFI